MKYRIVKNPSDKKNPDPTRVFVCQKLVDKTWTEFAAYRSFDEAKVEIMRSIPVQAKDVVVYEIEG